MAKTKLSYSWKVDIEVDNEDDLQMAMRNIPLFNVGSAQSNIRQVVSSDIHQLSLHTLADIEKEALIRALANNNFDKTATAKELGIERATVYAKIKKYGIEI